MIIPMSDHEPAHWRRVGVQRYIYICKNIYTSIFHNMFVIQWTNTFTELVIMISWVAHVVPEQEMDITYFSFWFVFCFLLEALHFIYRLVCTDLAFPVQLSLSSSTSFLAFLLLSTHLTREGSGKWLGQYLTVS